MAINNNHTVEDLGDVKCAIVEKEVSKERGEFLKGILEINNYKVVIVPSPPPKAAKTAPIAEVTEPAAVNIPSTFTVGVTDVRFNSINAIFGRLLKTKDGHVITLAYWKQEDPVSHDEVPYYEKQR